MKVELVNIGKRYENQERFTLRHIDLEIGDRDFTVILGPPDSGKSTLLRVMAGLIEITEGDLLLDGLKANRLEPRDRGIAMVFQSLALYPHMTAYDNMAFSLKRQKEKKEVIHARVLEVAQSLQICDRLYDRPSGLTDVQRRRLALGRALVRQPGLLLIDEFLSGLETCQSDQIRLELVRFCQSTEMSVVYATSDPVEAMSLASKIVLLNDGRIQQAGAPLDVYEKPANLLVAGFTGSPSMNLFPGEVADGLYKADDGFQIEPGEEDREKLSAVEGRRVTLGVRPEGMLEASPDAGDFALEVGFVQMRGREQLLYCRSPKGRECVISKTESSGPKAGETLHVHLDRARLHFFDEETGERLN